MGYPMNVRHIASLVLLALLSGFSAPPSLATDPPKMGGGYTNVIPIPVDDPAVKAIAGALLKPEGSGPFPTVVYIPPCGGPNFPPEFKSEQFVIDRMLSKGVAVFMVDTHTPRGEDDNCGKLLTVLEDVQNENPAVLQLMKQGGDDAVAALKVAKALPDVNPKNIFLMGFSSGATSALYATDPASPSSHDTEIAGVVAYYPLCFDRVEASVPTLILIGEKDDWAGPVAACQALKGRNNFEIVVFPGATHSFSMPFDEPVDYAGHHMAYDQATTMQAQEHVETFINAHLN